MKIPSVAAVLITVVTAAAAQANWVKVGVFEGRTLYIDAATANKAGSITTVWSLTDLKEPNHTARGRAYWSKKALLELDCSKGLMRVLQDNWFTQPMGEGEIAFSAEHAKAGFVPVPADSQAGLLWRHGCGKR